MGAVEHLNQGTEGGVARRTIGLLIAIVGVVATAGVLLAMLGGGGRVDWTEEILVLRDEDLARYAPSGSIVGSTITIFECRKDDSGDLKPGVGRRDVLNADVVSETVIAEFDEVANETGWTIVGEGSDAGYAWQSWSKQFDDWTGEISVSVREGEDSFVSAQISEPSPCPQFD